MSNQVLPGKWINKIFEELACNYGNQFLNQWKGQDIATVKAFWAGKLAWLGDKPAVIRAALDNLPSDKPPCLQVFQSLCRDAARTYSAAAPRLESKPDPVMAEKVKEAARAAAERMQGNNESAGGLEWARKPRSALAIAAVFDCAKKDSRFRTIRDKLIADGICNPDGSAINVWRDGRWMQVGKSAASANKEVTA